MESANISVPINTSLVSLINTRIDISSPSQFILTKAVSISAEIPSTNITFSGPRKCIEFSLANLRGKSTEPSNPVSRTPSIIAPFANQICKIASRLLLTMPFSSTMNLRFCEHIRNRFWQSKIFCQASPPKPLARHWYYFYQ